MNRLDFNQGVLSATRHLTNTCEDFEQIYNRALPAAHEAKGKQSLGWQAQIRNCEILKAKIDLLKGQVSNIIAECQK